MDRSKADGGATVAEVNAALSMFVDGLRGSRTYWLETVVVPEKTSLL